MAKNAQIDDRIKNQLTAIKSEQQIDKTKQIAINPY